MTGTSGGTATAAPPTANWSAGNERFDAEAAAWDSKPETVESSQAALQALIRHVPALANAKRAKELRVLEIGCGTGLLSLPLAERVHSLVGCDTSQGMIDMMRAKAERKKIDNVKALKLLLEDADDPALGGARFDLVVSHLVFHHIPRMADTLAVMARALASGGTLVVSDFEDDGAHALRFHPADKHGGVERHGLRRDEMQQLLEQQAGEVGLKDVRVMHSFTLDKTVRQDDGSNKKEPFPFLFAMASKA